MCINLAVCGHFARFFKLAIIQAKNTTLKQTSSISRLKQAGIVFRPTQARYSKLARFEFFARIIFLICVIPLMLYRGPKLRENKSIQKAFILFAFVVLTNTGASRRGGGGVKGPGPVKLLTHRN